MDMSTCILAFAVSVIVAVYDKSVGISVIAGLAVVVMWELNTIREELQKKNKE